MTTQTLGAIISTWYGLASIAAFVAFAWDKDAAKQERRRVRERTLHTLTLLGGFLGTLLAMRLLRHKTRKPLFRFMPWIALAAHAAFWLGVNRLLNG